MIEDQQTRSRAGGDVSQLGCRRMCLGVVGLSDPRQRREAGVGVDLVDQYVAAVALVRRVRIRARVAAQDDGAVGRLDAIAERVLPPGVRDGEGTDGDA